MVTDVSYISWSKPGRMIWMMHEYVSHTCNTGNACTILFEILERKRQLGRYKCKWEDNIKIGFYRNLV
jgi:hypothetical protein